MVISLGLGQKNDTTHIAIWSLTVNKYSSLWADKCCVIMVGLASKSVVRNEGPSLL